MIVEGLRVFGELILLYVVVWVALLSVVLVIFGLSHFDFLAIPTFCLLPIWYMSLAGLWVMTLPGKMLLKKGWGWPFHSELSYLEGDFGEFCIPNRKIQRYR